MLLHEEMEIHNVCVQFTAIHTLIKALKTSVTSQGFDLQTNFHFSKGLLVSVYRSLGARTV
jgi:hypothetical protein